MFVFWVLPCVCCSLSVDTGLACCNESNGPFDQAEGRSDSKGWRDRPLWHKAWWAVPTKMAETGRHFGCPKSHAECPGAKLLGQATTLVCMLLVGLECLPSIPTLGGADISFCKFLWQIACTDLKYDTFSTAIALEPGHWEIRLGCCRRSPNLAPMQQNGWQRAGLAGGVKRCRRERELFLFSPCSPPAFFSQDREENFQIICTICQKQNKQQVSSNRISSHL